LLRNTSCSGVIYLVGNIIIFGPERIYASYPLLGDARPARITIVRKAAARIITWLNLGRKLGDGQLGLC
jgi:hypothetical protein